jgi:transposase
MRMIASQLGMPRATLLKLKARQGWGRPARAPEAWGTRRRGGRPVEPETIAAARALVEGTTLPMGVIAARVGVCRDTVHNLANRHGWRRPRAARMPLRGQRGGGHPIVPEIVAEARALMEGTALSRGAIARRLGVSRKALQLWQKRDGWRRPPEAPGPLPGPLPDGRTRPARYRRGGRAYAADAVGMAHTLLTRSLQSQQEIADQIGVSRKWVGNMLRRRGWQRPPFPPGSRLACANRRTAPLATTGNRRGLPYAPEVRREARALWEVTSLPTALIAARIGVGPWTVNRWARRDGWERPRGRTGARQLRGYFGVLKARAGH